MAIDAQTVKQIGEQLKQVGQNMIDAVAPPQRHSAAVVPVAKQSVADALFSSPQEPDEALREAKTKLDAIVAKIDALQPGD